MSRKPRCGVCRRAGHNRRTCPEKKIAQQRKNPTQDEILQYVISLAHQIHSIKLERDNKMREVETSYDGRIQELRNQMKEVFRANGIDPEKIIIPTRQAS